MPDRVLIATLSICALLSPLVARGAEPDSATEVWVSHDVTHHPSVVLAPATAALGLDDAGYLRFHLDASAQAAAARYTVRFTGGSPFDHRERSAAATEHCLFGPLAAHDGVGTYAYEVELEDAHGHAVAAASATLEVIEYRSLPRIYLLLAALVGLLFLIFNYIEKPLTRSYETAAH